MRKNSWAWLPILGKIENNEKCLKLKLEIPYKNIQKEVNFMASVDAQFQIALDLHGKLKKAHRSY